MTTTNHGSEIPSAEAPLASVDICSVDLCPRHGFAMLAIATLDDHGNGRGTRLLGPKSCCAERREVARWSVTPDDRERIARELVPDASSTMTALRAEVERLRKQHVELRHAGAVLANCAYNLCQRKHLDADEHRSLAASQAVWDRTVAQHRTANIAAACGIAPPSRGR